MGGRLAMAALAALAAAAGAAPAAAAAAVADPIVRARELMTVTLERAGARSASAAYDLAKAGTISCFGEFELGGIAKCIFQTFEEEEVTDEQLLDSDAACLLKLIPKEQSEVIQELLAINGTDPSAAQCVEAFEPVSTRCVAAAAAVPGVEGHLQDLLTALEKDFADSDPAACGTLTILLKNVKSVPSFNGTAEASTILSYGLALLGFETDNLDLEGIARAGAACEAVSPGVTALPQDEPSAPPSPSPSAASFAGPAQALAVAAAAAAARWN